MTVIVVPMGRRHLFLEASLSLAALLGAAAIISDFHHIPRNADIRLLPFNIQLIPTVDGFPFHIFPQLYIMTHYGRLA